MHSLILLNYITLRFHPIPCIHGSKIFTISFIYIYISIELFAAHCIFYNRFSVWQPAVVASLCLVAQIGTVSLF